MKLRIALSILALCSIGQADARAAEANPAGVEFFEKNVRPVLADNCYRCHSNSATKIRGGLYLDSVAGILKGSDDGPVIVPGDPEHSPLISAIRREDKDTAMPPKSALSESAVAAITQWVKMGAPGPKEIAAAPGKPGAAQAAAPSIPGPAGPIHDPTAEYDRLRHQLWSWQPIKTATPPTGPDQGWARDDLDLFVLAEQEEKDLHPSADADKVTLIRRATYDLIGVAPTPAETDAFVRDSSPNAFEKVVDRLLASPHFGERWGRHWLDVARYGESTGMTRNLPYYYAWRYRDYVIAAFNSDKPYNQFITEQLAGDQLPASTPAQRDQQLIATGFLAIGPKDFNEKNPQQFLMNNVDEQIDVTGRALLATTISCARCHDHKFDPIPTKEYYGLAGIFRSTQTFTGIRRVKAAMAANFYDVDFLLPLSNYQPTTASGQDSDPTPPRQRRLLKQAAVARANKPPLDPALFNAIPEQDVAMGAKDVLYPADANILIRGDLDNVGAVANRGFLTIPCMTSVSAINSRTSGRLELAEWITRQDNPLTSRVIVNRIWKHLFGEGIVRTVDNFGMSGDQPDNPALLDNLASDFMKNGWSIKKMIRQIILSSTYRQASTFDQAKYAIDPDNRLLWRQNQRRLEAEAIRDSILASAGDLNAAPMSGSAVLKLAPAQIQRAIRRGFDISDVGTYRSIYLPIYRSALPEVLDTFDAADPDFVTGDREVTTVAPQALFMMNSPFILDQAGRMASRLESESRANLNGEVDLAYRLALGRVPSGSEHSRALSFINSFARQDRAAAAGHDGLAAFCQAIFSSAEFRYVN